MMNGAWSEMSEYSTGNPSYASMAERFSFGFTPINPTGPMPQFIDPLKTLHYPHESKPHHRHADGDNASDADRGDRVPYAKPMRKRNKSVMLDLFQEGVNEIDGAAKKKRRPVVQQRSKSANVPTRLSQLLIEDNAVLQDDSEVLLTSPDPKTKAKPKSRAKSKAKTSSSPTSMEPKQAPFKAPKITRLLSVEKVEATSVVVTKSVPVSNHPSLTTTENAVKNSTRDAVLSKTTMSKLHSFLYVPSISHVASAFPLSAQAKSHMSEPDPDTQVNLAFTSSTSKHGSGTSHDALTETRDENIVSVRSDQTLDLYPKNPPDNPSASAVHASDQMFGGKTSLGHQSHKDQELQNTEPRWEDVDVDECERYDVDGNVAETRGNIAEALSMALVQTRTTYGEPLHDLPVSGSDFDEPTFSELEAFTHLLDQAGHQPDVIKRFSRGSTAVTGMTEMASEELDSHDEQNFKHALNLNGLTREETNNELLPPFTQSTHIEMEDDPHSHNHHRGLQYLFDEEDNQRAEDEDILIEDLPLSDVCSDRGAFDHGGLLIEESRHLLAVSETEFPEEEDMLLNEYLLSEIDTGNGYGFETTQFDDQIPPPKIEFGDDVDLENMIFDNRTSPQKQVVSAYTHSEVDEFDDGLDDSDILDLLSADPMIEMREFNCDDLARRPDAKSAHQHGSVTNTISRTALPTPKSPQIIDLDPDDEFPMDENDEEELLKLPVLVKGIPRLELSSPRLPGHQAPSSKVHGSTPQTSPHRSLSNSHLQTERSPNRPHHTPIAFSQIRSSEPRSDPLGEGEYWAHLSTDQMQIFDLRDRQPIELSDEADSDVEELMPPLPPKRHSNLRLSVRGNVATHASVSMGVSEYESLQSFARPAFPDLIRDRCPVIGLSDQNFIRTCFKIGELFKEGKRCSSLGRDAIIELFARVTFSSRETGTMKQYFVFADLWRDHPPFPKGMLMNYKTTGLADTESKAFVDTGEPKMARCLGRLKRDEKNATGWSLHIITIRETDWEEIRYTKRAVCAGEIKSESEQV